ncbi:PEP-CTERM sorting domain-containing protein [Leptolyngbya sp. PCC 6406]|uniref:PEP-CTERM sorting domain-containing protein n=1 Tax=Leptolyngbya sp. PCC 6406 TaxID=1173264 RepID=UPI0002AC1B1B|nr:PEP-CTERM sorting domain-containing protein [Leptolyngbya sp. PCC 6406]
MLLKSSKLFIALGLGFALAASAVAPAWANGKGKDKGPSSSSGSSSEVSCQDSVLGTLANFCVGPVSGNDSASAVQSVLKDPAWTFLSKVDDSSGSASYLDVQQADNKAKSGTWDIDISKLVSEGITELAVAIKGGPTYSVYVFEDLSKLGDGQNLAWDTKGVLTGSGKAEPGLSHFSVYVKRGPVDPGPKPVPEPAALLGLVAVGGAAASLKRKQ